MKPSLAARRARVARVNAKRPTGLVVEAEYHPNPEARERLVDLLIELLDAQPHSRRG